MQPTRLVAWIKFVMLPLDEAAGGRRRWQLLLQKLYREHLPLAVYNMFGLRGRWWENDMNAIWSMKVLMMEIRIEL